MERVSTTLALAADALTPVNAQLGKHFAIIGVDATPDELLPGEQATVRVAWRADQPPPVDYSVFVHLVDADGLMKALREAGLVRIRIDGPKRFYSLDPVPLLELDQWLQPYREFWAGKLDALGDHLSRSD